MADPGKALKEDAAEMNMTPMIDVVFLLIIFFMLVSEISNLNTEQIQLPRAPETEVDKPKDASEIVVVNILQNGTIRAGGQTLWPLEGVEPEDKKAQVDRLVEWLKIELELKSSVGREDPGKIGTAPIEDLKVLVRCDARARYKHVLGLLDACQKVMVYQLNFASEKEDYNAPR